jgi:predicted permease
MMDKLWQDIRYAARHLVRSPVFTLGAVALLAIGIGANTTVFTLVDSLLFRPQPWTNPDEVVFVYQDSDDGEPSSSSFPATRDMAGSDVFVSVAAITPSNAAWEGPDGPQPVSTEYTTSSLMEVLGLSVQRGRWFGPEDDVPGNGLVAVVSAPTWHSRFGSDPDVVGRTVRLNGQPVTIIGVGPEALTGTYTPLVTDFWLSISSTIVTGTYQVQNLEFRSDHWYDVRARLAPGVTVQQAQAAMDALAARLAEEYPEYNRGRGITVFSSRDVRVHPSGDGDMYLAGGLLSAVVLTVLLLACANLANLLLVRGLSRSGEMAVRSALGAPRGRVARLFLIESLLLAALGGAAGLLLTRWALAAIPSLPLADVMGGTLELAIDGRVAFFSVGLMVLTGVLFGLAPAVRSARTDVAQALRDDRRGSSGGRGTMRMRSLLVAVQVAASLILVLGTGLLARSLSALQSLDAGLDVDRVAYVRTDWSQAGLQGGEDGRVAIDEMRRRVEAIPGVTLAALATRLPAQNQGSTTTEVEGYTPPAGTDAVELPFAVVSDGFFETMGIPLRAGRLFSDDDVAGTSQTSILINETAARRFYGDADPIGRRMRSQGSQEWNRTIVGVVGDVPVGSLGEDPRPIFYFSTRQTTRLPGYLVARTEGDPGALAANLRQAVSDMSVTVSVSAQGTLASHFGATLSTPRMAARAMGAFSLLALLLAGLGIYAVVSFSVARRTAELGIRMALGAGRAGVVRMVVREVVGVVVVGLVAGLAIAGLAATRIGGLLYGIDALDPVTFVGAVATLVLVSGVAAYVPARRAAGADPVEALRAS